MKCPCGNRITDERAHTMAGFRFAVISGADADVKDLLRRPRQHARRTQQQGHDRMTKLKKKDHHQFITAYVAAYMAGDRIRQESVGQPAGTLSLEDRLPGSAEAAGYAAQEAWDVYQATRGEA